MKTLHGFEWPTSFTEDPDLVVHKANEVGTALTFVRRYRYALQANGGVGVIPANLARRFLRVMTFEPSGEYFKALKRNCRKTLGVAAFNEELLDIETLHLERCDFIYLDTSADIIRSGEELLKREKPVVMLPFSEGNVRYFEGLDYEDVARVNNMAVYTHYRNK